MRNTILGAWTVMLSILLFFPLSSSAQIVIGKEPGTEITEVTPGPGWKTCPRCQNSGHMAADQIKYKVDGHPFDPHDLSGVWGSTCIPPDMKTRPPLTPPGQKPVS